MILQNYCTLLIFFLTNFSGVYLMAKTRIVKKYPNRRLYDTVISSYVTVEDIRQLVTDGEDFEVQDAKTGADLTRQVLLQIISECEEKGQPMLSTRLLSQLIRFYGDQLQGFMASYLERSLQTFLDQQQQFRAQLNTVLGQSPLSVFQSMTERNLELFKQFQSGVIGAAIPPGFGVSPTTTPTANPTRPASGPGTTPHSSGPPGSAARPIPSSRKL